VGFGVNGYGSYALGNHVSLRTGVGYAYKRVHEFWYNLVMQHDIDPQDGIIGSTTMEERSHFHELQVPVLAILHLQSPGKGPYVGLGTVASWFFVRRMLVNFESTTGEQDFFIGDLRRPYNLALQACIGRRSVLSTSTSLGLELYAQSYLGSYFPGI
jgi:hypothetical protein